MWGGKKKDKPCAGFLDDMSEEQTAKLHEFRANITENGTLTHP
jgi:hypothetical protein